ncbi:MAG: hypothetical protein WCK77_07765 [Verrucomicrobiota bacterium]
MKTRLFWVVIPAVILSFGACKKTEEAAKPAASTAPTEASPGETHPAAPAAPAAPATPAASPTKPAAAVVAPPQEVKALNAEERAAKLGFVRYLPQTTESVISVYNGTKIGDRAKGMKLWKVIGDQLGLGMMGLQGGAPMVPGAGMDNDEKPKDEDFAIPEGEQDKAKPAAAAKPKETTKPAGTATGALLGAAAAAPEDGAAAEPDMGVKVVPADADDSEDAGAGPFTPGDMLGLEVTFAVGKSAGEQLVNLSTLGNRLNYFQIRALAKAYAAAVKAGDMSTLKSSMGAGFGEDLVKNLVNDPESGVALLERSSMPPVYVAFRTTKDKQAAVAAGVTEAIGSMGQGGEMVETLDFEKAGAKFTGFKLVGSKLSEQIATDRGSMDEMLGAETGTKLLAAVAKKNLVVASATLGDYVVIFIGAAETDCNLVSEPAQSLASGSALAFSDAYAAKELAALIVGNDSVAKAINQAQTGLIPYTNGLRDGLAGEDGLSDTRDLQALLQMVADREAALRKLGGMEALGMVAYFEEGLKVESFGGYDAGAIDWKTPTKLSQLGEGADVAFFADVTSEAAFDAKARAYYEALVETAYAMAMKVSELPGDDGPLKQFKSMATLFNDKFRGDAVALWDALKGGATAGLGQERAVVIDLKGTVPALPGIPQLLVDKGRFPRATMVAPVTDRAKLAASWTQMNEACTKLLAKVSEVSGQEIPMQKPMSSEKAGYTTWYMSLPCLSDDFVPSVTVGDKWFAASTSKNRALELLATADKGTAGRTGAYIKVDFKAMQECLAETMKLVDENSKAVLGEDTPQLEKFTSSKEMRTKLLDAMAELDSLTIHSRREGAVLRGSIHFKTR